ncbi:MAG: DUF6348 family protein [Prevotella sp.]|jgi:hypothetical protein|nr:DUF6348 family protein [Prevotella sp.]
MAIGLEQYEEQLNTFLVHIFREHGVKCEIENNTLIFKHQRMTAYARLFDMSATSATLLQLDVSLEIGMGKEILESCIGMGMDMESATKNAWDNFLKNSFHVLLSAFFKPGEDDQVTRYKWVIGGRKYDIFMSQMSVRGTLPDPYPEEWYDELQKIIKKQNLTEGTHWARLYYAQSQREMMRWEILLDNQSWTDIEPEVRTLNFPKSQDFLSLRIFFVMKDEIDVSQAASAMAWLADKDLPEIEDTLVSEGWSVSDAEKALVFIPLAFGRIFLQSFTTTEFPNEATVTNEADDETKINLGNEPIYTSAYRLAQYIMQKGCVNKKHFEMLLSQSSEFNAYNQALKDGATKEDLDGAHFGSPMLFMYNYQPPIINPVVPDDADNENKEKPQKKSWKFWKR